MFLTHGMNESNELISVDYAKSGRTSLRCPFCSELLIARKGSIKEHHFAHVSNTCNESKATIQQTGIAFYDNATGISKTELNLLDKFRRFENVWLTENQQKTVKTLASGGLLRPMKDRPEKLGITKLGRDLLRFNDPVFSRGNRDIVDTEKLQERMFPARLAMLEQQDLISGTQAAKFYSLRLQSILNQHLYILNINFKKDSICYPLIKVGITSRPDMKKRIKEIESDLQKHGEFISIKTHSFYKHFGSLERQIHKKLSSHQFKIGSHTEYFSSIMASKDIYYLGLEELGRRKIDGANCRSIYRNHSHKVKAGQYRSNTKLGRPLKDHQALINGYPDIEAAYSQNLSLRKARESTGKAINTIRKVYAALKET